MRERRDGPAAGVRRLRATRDDEWVPLASGEDRTVASLAWRRLAELGVDLPARPTRRDVWAAGIRDTDLRFDHFYLGPRRGTCAIQVSVRRAALEAARRVTDIGVSLDLVPGVGARLGSCRLDFGMSADEVGAALARVGTVEPARVCGAAWARRRTLGGSEVTLGADADGGLAFVAVSTPGNAGTGALAVGFDDVDLLGWPVDALVPALREAGHGVRDHGDGNVWVDDRLWLRHDPPPAREGRKSRRWTPGHVTALCLYSSLGPPRDGSSRRWGAPPVSAGAVGHREAVVTDAAACRPAGC